MRSRSVVALLLAGGITALAAHQAIDRPSRGGAPTSGLIGFSPAALERERKAEASFMAGVSPDAMADLHRRITARPHVAGSPASMEVAATLVRALADAGLETEVDDHEVLLSTPESIRVAITAPRKRDLPVTEPARPEEPASSHPDLGPGYVAYSASGSAAAPVVYVNYGLPPDYARVNAAGIDVKGKIVIARYARSHRAV
jgi:N-acetylated-alpha-linked acidic dipeptidase